MTFAAIAVAQDAGLAFRGGRSERRLGLWLDDSQRVAACVAFWTVVAVALEARTLLARRTIIPWAVVIARTLVPWPIILGPLALGPLALGPIIPGTLIARSVIALPISGSVVPGSVAGPLISPGAIATPLAAGVVVAIAVLVARAVVALPVSLSTVSRTIIALLRAVFVARTLSAAIFPRLPGFRRVPGFSRGRVSGFGLGLGAFVFKIDVEARGEVVAAEDFARRTGGLHSPKEAEVVFGVL